MGKGVMLFFFMFCANMSATGQELLKVGEHFPEFTLSDQNGTVFSSASLAGKPYLLWFYPKASTPGCTREGCKLRDRFADFQRFGVQVIGVSFDTPEENKRFAQENRFPFPLLSDINRQLALRVGAAESPRAYFPKRISYLVGADGKILRVYSKVSPAAHAEEVVRDLEKLELTRAR